MGVKEMEYGPTILALGFEPFFDNPLNPSWEAVRLLPDEVMGSHVEKRQLPVGWFECVRLLDEYMAELRPRAVLASGQGHPKPPVLIERVGINVCSGPDNTCAVDMYEEPVFHGAPAAYFSTIPYQAMHRRLKEEGIPVRYSFHAGINQCNCVLYSALHFATTRYPNTVAGFIHVPMLPRENIEGMPLETTAKAILYCVEELAKSLVRPVRTLEQYRESL
jgi:pyroglutamyl-peptidase